MRFAVNFLSPIACNPDTQFGTRGHIGRSLHCSLLCAPRFVPEDLLVRWEPRVARLDDRGNPITSRVAGPCIRSVGTAIRRHTPPVASAAPHPVHVRCRPCSAISAVSIARASNHTARSAHAGGRPRDARQHAVLCCSQLFYMRNGARSEHVTSRGAPCSRLAAGSAHSPVSDIQYRSDNHRQHGATRECAVPARMDDIPRSHTTPNRSVAQILFSLDLSWQLLNETSCTNISVYCCPVASSTIWIVSKFMIDTLSRRP